MILPGFLGSTLLQQPADTFFHFLARLEGHHKLFRYKDFLTCPRIAGLPWGTSFYLKNAEISQLDPFILDERIYDCVERLLDDFLRLQLGKTNFLGDSLDDFFLGHGRVPYEKVEGPRRRPWATLAPSETLRFGTPSFSLQV